MKGKIKFYKTAKKWGFIVGEDEQDYFFHDTDLINCYEPKKNDPVLFGTARARDGLKAIKVQEIKI